MLTKMTSSSSLVTLSAFSRLIQSIARGAREATDVDQMALEELDDRALAFRRLVVGVALVDHHVAAVHLVHAVLDRLGRQDSAAVQRLGHASQVLGHLEDRGPDLLELLPRDVL